MRKIMDVTLKIEFQWDSVGKRWKILWTQPAPSGKGVLYHWKWIDSTEPLDALNARRLVHAIEQEMLAWLPFSLGL